MPNANVQVQDEAPSFFSRFKYLIFAWVAINIVTQFFAKPANNDIDVEFDNNTNVTNGVVNSSMQFYKPIWVGNTSLDLHVYVSDNADPASTADAEPILTDLGITFDSNFDETVNFNVPIDGAEFVAANKSLYAHMFFSEAGKPWRPTDEGYDPLQAYVASRPLTKYIGPPKKVVKKHLLGGPEDEAPEPEENEEIIEYDQPVPYYHPNVTVGLVQLLSPFKIDDQATWFQHFTPIERAENATGPNLYFPGIYLNQFWQLHSQHIRINTTTTSIPLSVEFHTMSAMKFQMYHGIEEQKQQGTMAEMDKVKEILLDSNPYLLGITFIVSLLHSLFEFLAFKNDISHWRQKKDTIGVSVRSIIANVVMQTIIFLYLLDNNDNTSFMILFGQISGIVIEAWKITKVLDFKVENGSLVVKDKHELSEIEQKTKEYDEIIFKYMYIGAIPLILAYAAYALIYLTHKSWYSFVITTLVGSVYAYGFLMLVPAIYINYRLKSVAHMPRKAMVYKFLNTFIDDLFAFVIKMPLLHRLATLRDDIIFFIYLYQTWLYKVDYTRVNEFGQVGEEEENKKKEDEKEDGKNDEKEIGEKEEEPKKTK